MVPLCSARLRLWTGTVHAAAADTLELTEENVEAVLDEIRPYLMADGKIQCSRMF